MPFSPWTRRLLLWFRIISPLPMSGIMMLPSVVWCCLMALPMVTLRCHRNRTNHRRLPSYTPLTHHPSTLVPRITKLRSVVCLRPSVSVVVYRCYPINVERDTQASIFLFKIIWYSILISIPRLMTSCRESRQRGQMDLHWTGWL